jgi:hypothetical protein
MTKKTRNWLVVLLSIPAAVVIAVVGLLIFLELQPLPPIQPLPNPNGYNDLVKAGEMLTKNVSHYDEMKQQELRALVETNSIALQLARMGLQQECRVPLDYSPTSSIRFDKLSSIRHLAFAFEAEGRLAEMERRTNDAIKSYLDLGRLANQSACGGVLIDQMVSTVLEAMETERLQKLVEHLDPKSCRETAKTLETLDAQKRSWIVVIQQENAWSRRTFPELRYRLGAIMDANSQKKIVRDVARRYEEQQLRTRRLIVEFAARAYELDKGHHPTNLTDLVPDYLKAIPQDPFTGTNMVYLPR